MNRGLFLCMLNRSYVCLCFDVDGCHCLFFLIKSDKVSVVWFDYCYVLLLLQSLSVCCFV